MFTKKYDWTSKDILDQFEVNYEVVEKILSDIKQKVDNKIDKNLYITELVYYAYEPLSSMDVYYIEAHLPKRYSMELVEYVYTTDLFCNDVMRFKIRFDEYERSLNDNGYKTEQ